LGLEGTGNDGNGGGGVIDALPAPVPGVCVPAITNTAEAATATTVQRSHSDLRYIDLRLRLVTNNY